MCFTLTSLTWTSEGPREDCQGTECTQNEQDFAVLHNCLYSICLYMHMHVHATYCTMTSTISSHAQTNYLCRQWLSYWVHLKLCRVTCSLLAAALVLPSGWTRPRQALDLTWAMFSGAPPWLILSELFGSQLWQTRVLPSCFEVKWNDVGVYMSLWPVTKMTQKWNDKVTAAEEHNSKVLHTTYNIQVVYTSWANRKRRNEPGAEQSKTDNFCNHMRIAKTQFFLLE